MKDMEIGEVREYNGKRYRCEHSLAGCGRTCPGWSVLGGCIADVFPTLGSCFAGDRQDGKSVHFVEIPENPTAPIENGG